MWLAVCFILLEEVREAPSCASLPAQPVQPDSGGLSAAQPSASDQQSCVNTGVDSSERGDLQETELLLSPGILPPDSITTQDDAKRHASH